MIRHIVLFSLAATEEAQRASDTAAMKQRLEGLVGTIPGLRTLTVSRDLGEADDHFDIAMVSEHDDKAALEAYKAHPAHVEARAFVRSVVNRRAILDHEC